MSQQQQQPKLNFYDWLITNQKLTKFTAKEKNEDITIMLRQVNMTRNESNEEFYNKIKQVFDPPILAFLDQDKISDAQYEHIAYTLDSKKREDLYNSVQTIQSYYTYKFDQNHEILQKLLTKLNLFRPCQPHPSFKRWLQINENLAAMTARSRFKKIAWFFTTVNMMPEDLKKPRTFYYKVQQFIGKVHPEALSFLDAMQKNKNNSERDDEEDVLEGDNNSGPVSRTLNVVYHSILAIRNYYKFLFRTSDQLLIKLSEKISKLKDVLVRNEMIMIAMDPLFITVIANQLLSHLMKQAVEIDQVIWNFYQYKNSAAMKQKITTLHKYAHHYILPWICTYFRCFVYPCKNQVFICMRPPILLRKGYEPKFHSRNVLFRALKEEDVKKLFDGSEPAPPKNNNYRDARRFLLISDDKNGIKLVLVRVKKYGKIYRVVHTYMDPFIAQYIFFYHKYCTNKGKNPNLLWKGSSGGKLCGKTPSTDLRPLLYSAFQKVQAPRIISDSTDVTITTSNKELTGADVFERYSNMIYLSKCGDSKVKKLEIYKETVGTTFVTDEYLEAEERLSKIAERYMASITKDKLTHTKEHCPNSDIKLSSTFPPLRKKLRDDMIQTHRAMTAPKANESKVNN